MEVFYEKDSDPELLKENLPDLLKVCINLNKDIIWNIDKPFSFNNAKLANVKGKVNKNFPPIANKIAKTNKPRIVNILKLFDIFFDEILLTNFKRK